MLSFLFPSHFIWYLFLFFKVLQIERWILCRLLMFLFSEDEWARRGRAVLGFSYPFPSFIGTDVPGLLYLVKGKSFFPWKVLLVFCGFLEGLILIIFIYPVAAIFHSNQILPTSLQQLFLLSSQAIGNMTNQWKRSCLLGFGHLLILILIKSGHLLSLMILLLLLGSPLLLNSSISGDMLWVIVIIVPFFSFSPHQEKSEWQALAFF